jgi:hypothetical protein
MKIVWCHEEPDIGCPTKRFSNGYNSFSAFRRLAMRDVMEREWPELATKSLPPKDVPKRARDAARLAQHPPTAA